MPSEDAFLQAVIADPDDDAPRLIYADWLDENGRCDRAEFIRVQCEVARLPKGDAGRRELKARARALLARHGKRWAAPLRGLATHCRFRRGFVERVTVPARVVVAGTEGLRRLQPIRAVLVTVAPDVIDLVPESVARENDILPLVADVGRLWIAGSELSHRPTIEKLEFILNREITPVPMPVVELWEGINRHYGEDQTVAVDPTTVLGEFVCTAFDPDNLPEPPPPRSDDGPVVGLLNTIVGEAVARGADAVLVLPGADNLQVRYHIDGSWTVRDTPPRRLLEPLVARIKILAGIDLAERNCRRRGRIGMTAGRWCRIAVVITPDTFGPSVMMRIER